MNKISQHFDNDLWQTIIKPAIDNAYAKIDESFANEVGLKRFDDKEYKIYLSTLYEEKRDWLKQIYFGNSNAEKEHNLDMHKISAVICRSLIGCKPFSFDVNKANKYKNKHKKNDDLDWIINNYFINYKVATDCAIGIVLYDLIEKLGNEEGLNKQLNNRVDIMLKLTKNGFNLYRDNSVLLQSEHEPFYKSMILNLAINDSNKRQFDYLGFAMNSFQLQQYEILKCQYDIK